MHDDRADRLALVRDQLDRITRVTDGLLPAYEAARLALMAATTYTAVATVAAYTAGHQARALVGEAFWPLQERYVAARFKQARLREQYAAALRWART